jgi:hypothetical protein
MAVTIELANLDYSEHVDISSIALTRKVMPRHNGPRTAVIEAPSGSSLLTDTFGDGDPALRKGNRKLIVWDDEAITDDNTTGIVFHGRVFLVERVGDGETNKVTITAFQPLWSETGFEGDDRAGRVVRDSTGNFIDPDFSELAVADEIAAGTLVHAILENSQVVGSEGDPGGEGPLPIDIDTGPFDAAADVSPSNDMAWPKYVGDFLRQIVDTNLVDIVEVPVDPVEGSYVMTSVSVVDLAGEDASGTVHFDYWTGSYNAKAARHVEDFTVYCSKLYDYLGPRIDQSHWGGNITPGSPGTTSDPTASRAKYGGPGTDHGQFILIRIFDANDVENSLRPLYLKLWDAEQLLRMEPGDKLYLTPAPGDYALFQPFGVDYDTGYLVAVNVGGDFGVNIAAVQRVYGYDVEWDREDVKRVTNLLVSADAS